jgi:hypothetical protein
LGNVATKESIRKGEKSISAASIEEAAKVLFVAVFLKIFYYLLLL